MQQIHDLIIDIGNSRVKFYPPLESFPSPKINNFALDLFIVSTVEKKTYSVIEELKNQYTINKINFFNSNEQNLIQGLYTSIGNDRIAKLLGASLLNPSKDIILIDFGTATTLNIIDSQKNFKGGLIALGMNSSLKALSEYCDALPDYSLDPELEILINEDFKSSCTNQSTKTSILLGAISSHTALIKQWIDYGKTSLGRTKNLLTVCTGGEAMYFKKIFDEYISEEDLLRACLQSRRTRTPN